MRTIISIALTVLLVAPAFAEPVTMICKNPGREYLATFDGSSLVLDPDTDATAYTVLAHQPDGVVAGMVGHDSGLGFAAYFNETSKIDFYSNDKVVQTDTCRPDNTPTDIGMGN